MNNIQKRRLRNIFIAVCASIAVLWLLDYQVDRLRQASFTSGYLLFGAVVFLTSYNWRKKLPVMPVGSSAFWLQLHIYVGFVGIIVFLAHIGFRIPNGIFESILAAVFVVVAASGIYGLYLSRVIPRKLTQIPNEVIYERVPALRREIAESATALAFESVSATHATTVAEFYANRLHAFFVNPQSIWYTAFPNSRRRRSIMSELSQMERFFSQSEKKVSEKLFSLIRMKDDLEYQFALQHKLKVWLFGHIGLTYSLLVMSIFHMSLVHAFHGGM